MKDTLIETGTYWNAMVVLACGLLMAAGVLWLTIT